MVIVYRKQCPYVLEKRADLYEQDLRLTVDVSNPFFRIRMGVVTVLPGYSWDGPSGPTRDTENAMRGSLFHDVLYQAMREGLITRKHNRRIADKVFRRHLKEDGMTFLRRWLWWIGVRLFARHAAVGGST